MRTRGGTLLVVDLSNQVYKATSVNKGLTSGDTFTGGLFGFLMSLCTTINDVKADRVVIGTDTRPYIRSRDYPQYKELRKKTADPEVKALFEESMILVRHFCQELGLPVWSVPGFEYDDLIAHCVVKYRHRFDNIVAYSNDSDMYQFMWCPRFKVYKGKKQGGLYGLKEFQQEWPGIEPRDLPRILAMTGTHNDVEGIAGVGPATALKAIKDPFKYRELRAKGNNASVIDRNLPLITLPHPDFPFDEEIPRHTKKFVSPRPLYRYCSAYDITVQKYMTDALERVLT